MDHSSPQKTDSMKRCNHCKRYKPLGEFHNMTASKDGKQAKCKECVAVYGRRNPEKNLANQRSYRKRHGPELKLRERIKMLMDRHGLTPEQFEVLLAAQDGRCAICRSNEPGGYGTWHVDHSHSCCPAHRSCEKCRRGLLCQKCNTAIGLLNDDPTTLRAATEYVMRHIANSSPLTDKPYIGAAERN